MTHSLMAAPPFFIVLSWLVFSIFFIGVLTLLVIKNKMDTGTMCIIVIFLLIVSQFVVGTAIEDLKAYLPPPAATKPNQ